MGGSGPGRAGHLALLLVIMNVALFSAGMLFQQLAKRSVSMPEFNAQQIRILAHPDALDAAPQSVETLPDMTAVDPDAPAPRVCLQVTGFDQGRYDDVMAMFDAAGVTSAQCRVELGMELGWWVYWPPEYELLLREKAIRSFRAAGVRDVLPISQGPMAQSFSLGVFAREEQARNRRNELRSKGLEKVEFGPRPQVTEAYIACILANPDQKGRLNEGLLPGVQVADESVCAAQFPAVR